MAAKKKKGEPLDGEVLEPTEFPQAGLDLTPTAEGLAKGRHGNGSWNITDGSVELAYAEMHQARKELADERLHHFHERAKDAIDDAVDLHHRLIKRGKDIMARIEQGEKVPSWELGVLKMAQASSKELVDRAAGKSKQMSERTEKASLLMSMIKVEGGPDDARA